MSVPSWNLAVDRAGFAKALRSVGRAGKEVHSATAVLTFDQNRLAIDLSGNVTHIPWLLRLCEEHAAEGTQQFRESDAKAIAQIAQFGYILAPMGVETMEIKALMDRCLRNAWK